MKVYTGTRVVSNTPRLTDPRSTGAQPTRPPLPRSAPFGARQR